MFTRCSRMGPRGRWSEPVATSPDLPSLRRNMGSDSFTTARSELPAQDVAHQLGHTDGGALVQRLYGHPSERLARDRIKRATTGKLSVVSLPDAEPGQP